MEVDVFILGAGPAGSSAGLNLAPFCKVLIIDREATPKPRAGESLPPAANKLLSDMGLLEDFRSQGHLPYHGNKSRWGSSCIMETDFLRDPSGHGWHLDRQKFECWLRNKVVERGGKILAPARLEEIARDEYGYWRVSIRQNNQIREVSARILIDAGGRTPAIARSLAAARQHTDKLVCSWAIIDDSSRNQTGLSYIESNVNGWWYTAPTPNHQRIIAFHTDADNVVVSSLHSAKKLLELASEQSQLAEQIESSLELLTDKIIEYGYTAANSAVTYPTAGKGWLAVGDAAISFDPLSSQGIFNALYTGLAAAESAYRYLQSEVSDFLQYQQQIDNIYRAYQAHIKQWYGNEKRWKEESFWKNRLEF